MPTGHKRVKRLLENLYDAEIHDVFRLQGVCEYFTFSEVFNRLSDTLPNPSTELLRGSLERFVQQRLIAAATFSGTLLYKRIAQPQLPAAEPAKED